MSMWRIALVSPHNLLLIDCLMGLTYALRRDQMDDPNFNCGQWIQEKKQMNPVSKVNAQGELNNTDRIVLVLMLTKLPAELANIEDYIGLQDVVAQLFGLPSLQAQILAAMLVPESKRKAGPKLKAKPEFKVKTVVRPCYQQIYDVFEKQSGPPVVTVMLKDEWLT
ncbi:hypothetical protein FRB99_003852 [Tulasnella sp. 403]|nr:hypothetical protein FRB99_003852 [Tulasnella sp. 403]